MKSLTVGFVLVCLAMVAYAVEQKYTTKYDNIDIDEILKSDRLFKNYFNCLMDIGKCTPPGSELKRRIPDALKDGCSKCSEKQKTAIEKAIRYLIENRTEEWKNLQAKYDPDNIFLTQYKERIHEHGIKINLDKLN